MKRKIFQIVLVLATFQLSCFGQSYSVLNVIGTIKIKSSGAVIKKGDVISPDEQIVFVGSGSKAAVFSAAKGRFTLAPATATSSSGSEFLAYVRNSLIPNTNTLATRGGGTIQNLIDFKNKLGSGKFLVLPGTAIGIASESFKTDDQHFFFLRYTYNGASVNKKLPFENGKLVLEASQILSVDNKPISSSEIKDFQFFTYNGETKTSEPLCDFDPAFTDPVDLKESAMLINNAMKENNSDAATIKKEVLSYFTEYFGQPDEDSFGAWMKKEFGL